MEGNNENTEPERQLARGERHLPDREVQLAGIREHNKTLRYGIVCGTALLGLVSIVVGIVQVTKPEWVSIIGALGGMAATFSGLLLGTIKVYTRYKRKVHKRMRQLERRLDPDRTSSLPRLRALSPDESDDDG